MSSEASRQQLSARAKRDELANRELGKRLRQLRQQRGLTLREVAARTQLSSSFISLLENGETDVAFGRLQRLLVGIEATLADALPADSMISPTGPSTSTRLPPVAPGISLVVLSPPNSDIIACLVRVGSDVEMDAWTSSPWDVWIYMLDGRIRLQYSDSETVILERDASLLVLAGRPYKIMNLAGTESRFLRVQPHRRLEPTWKTKP